MQYRRFGHLDWKSSALGFGAMRLPTLEKDSAIINEEEAAAMIRYAIDHGVNYVDTAYPYHGGQSEILVGKVLQDGYREKVKLATKMPCWLVKSQEDFDRYLDEQLMKLQTDHIDFYLLHGLNQTRWSEMQRLNVLSWAEKAIGEGRFHNLGFSFHDDYNTFKSIVDGYDRWTFCQIQYNYMDIKNQAGTRGLRYAASKGLAVVIMEPILGGRLVNPPKAVKAAWDEADTQRTAAEWALQWLWDQPEISVVLSGMSTMQQVVENVASAKKSSIGTLTQNELDLVERVQWIYRDLSPIPCTKCNYCLPCPNGVNIPRNFEIYNEAMMYEKIETARVGYNRWFRAEEHADQCIECLECEDKCPQQIAIATWLIKVHELLSEVP